MGNVPPSQQGQQGVPQHGGYPQFGAGGQSVPQQSSAARSREGAGVSYPAPMVQGATYNYQGQGQGSSYSPANASQYQPYANQQQQSPPKRRSANDITMVDADSDVSHGDGQNRSLNNHNEVHQHSNHAALLAAAEEDTVPTVFRWEHGGRQVYITGTFNDWSRQIPMHRSGNDFTYIHNLKRGKHAFKFIVDDEWRFAPDQPTVADIEGRINNFIDVSDFVPYTGDRHFEERVDGGGVTAAILAAGRPIADADLLSSIAEGAEEHKEAVGMNGLGPHHHQGETSIMAHHYYQAEAKEEELFKQTMPDLDEYTKEPPPLPPHLRHIILNKAPQLSDTAALPVPQHVALNHLYCTAIKDNMMVLGITQRYKTKFATTVYYSPCD